ncbi:SPOR domain-containing protein [Roseomonas mucosa]|uniref:SPOR domain-containing protein n=1 Tax=Roseomonas mucosa TaxID=207340 RepID=UPI0030CF19E6
MELAEASAPRRAAPPQTLSLVGTAHAGTLSRPGLSTATAAPGTGSWAVQVGAYASESQARTAANQARSKIPANGVRVAVQPVMQGKTVLYRARVMGLSRDGAQNACEKLRSGRGACMTLSPDSQS